jgi:UDP-N-acetylglucosamine 2-epimerase
MGNHTAVSLISPVQYCEFVYLMKCSYMVVTDSGGVQEEAPSLGLPVVVTRDTTERPEAVEAGTVMLAGSKAENISKHVHDLLNNEDLHKSISVSKNPYGDGNARHIIARDLEEYG